MSGMSQASTVRERNVLARAGLLVSWKSELGMQLGERGEAEEMCSQESLLTDGCGRSCNCQGKCGHL